MITRDDWLRALQDAETVGRPPDDPSVVTAREFAALLGLKRFAAQERLRALLEAGRVEIVQKAIQRVSGYVAASPCLSLIGDEPCDIRDSISNS